MEIDREVVNDFREMFVAFEDFNVWPFDAVTSALYMALPEVGSSRWGAFAIGDHNSMKRRGLYLLAAHYLVLTYPEMSAKSGDPIRSSTPLNIASKSLGDASLSYRVGQMQSSEDDWLSTSNYGTMFLRLRSSIVGGAGLDGVVPFSGVLGFTPGGWYQ